MIHVDGSDILLEKSGKAPRNSWVCIQQTRECISCSIKVLRWWPTDVPDQCTIYPEKPRCQLVGRSVSITEKANTLAGPQWTDGGDREKAQLESAIRSALETANAQKARSISIPAVSLGIYAGSAQVDVVGLGTWLIVKSVVDFFQS